MTTDSEVTEPIKVKGNGGAGAAIPAMTAGTPAPLPQPKPKAILRQPAKDQQEPVQEAKAEKAKPKAEKAKPKAEKAKAGEIPAGTKLCPKCGKTKSLSEFPHSRKNGEMKPRFACTPCYKAYTQEAAKAASKPRIKKVAKLKIKPKAEKQPKFKIKRRAKIVAVKAAKPVGRPPKRPPEIAEVVQSLQPIRDKAMKRVRDLQDQMKALAQEVKAAEASVGKIDKILAATR